MGGSAVSRGILAFVSGVVAMLIVQMWWAACAQDAWVAMTSATTTGFYALATVMWARLNRERFWRYYAGYLPICAMVLALQAWGRTLQGREPLRTEHPLLATAFTLALLLGGAAAWSVLRRYPGADGRTAR